MTKKITSLDEAPVDVVEAVKRGFIHRGFIPRKYRRHDPTSPDFILNKKPPEAESNKARSGSSKRKPDQKASADDTSQEGSDTPDEQAAKDPLDNQPQDQHNQSEDNDSGGEGSQPIYKHDDDKSGYTESSNKPDEKIGKRKAGFQEVEPQDGRNSQRRETVEDEQRAEKPEGGEGGTSKDWPPQNLRNEITSTDPDISVIDSETGSQEAAKDPLEPEPGKIHEKLIDITEKAHDVLFKADSVFPFALFPDTLTLDREKLTIANRSFFRVAKIITVPITSMISAEADVGPFFGTVRMTSKYFIDNTHEVKYLWRHDATAIHRLLQGFIIAHERNLELHEIDKDDLKVLLEDLGQGVSD